MTELTRRILSGQTLHSDGITTILQSAIGQQNSPGSPLPSWLSAVQTAKNTQNPTPNLANTAPPDPYTMTILASQIPAQPAQIDAGQLSFFQYLAG
jgi:hypothetical protein